MTEEFQHRGREIPWLAVTQFHKEIVARAEKGFFSLNGRDNESDRWTSLRDFEPGEMAGPWSLAKKDMRSKPFRLALDQGRFESLFLGGPCYLAYEKFRDVSMPQWRPLLYREVGASLSEGVCEITPREGRWSLSPMVFQMLDRMESALSADSDELVTAILETAATYEDVEPLHERLMRALESMAPGIESQTRRRLDSGALRDVPTPWVLFAPTGSVSAITRYTMQDYERLESLLTEDGASIGGLRLLEDRATEVQDGDTDVLPVIPLNEPQRLAVQRILEGHPLTVISGPPGTGKSQVVVALLLNAWAQGKTVLFTSNNNKAVDVVRERVERFESEFPILVRAGNRQVQNIDEVLRRTLNMAGQAKRGGGADGKAAERLRRRQELTAQRAELLEALESELPQRIDEAKATALRAYGEYRETLVAIDEREDALESEQAELGMTGKTADEIGAALESSRRWLASMEEHRRLADDDERLATELQSAIADHERRRARAAAGAGLGEAEAGDWRWLVAGPQPEAIADWAARLRTLLSKPLESSLEELEWLDDYDRWRSSAEAEDWAQSARQFAETVRRVCGELAPKLAELNAVRLKLDEGVARAAERGLPGDMDVPGDALKDWAAAYAELATTEPRATDVMPWSRRAKLRRRLQGDERQIRPNFPLEVLTGIGTLNDDGRRLFAPIVEAARQLLEARQAWESAQPLTEQVEAHLAELRSQAAVLKLGSVPVNQDVDEWTPVARECEERAQTADRAAGAWRKRADREETQETLRDIAKEWSSLAAGVPLREAWRGGQGAEFNRSMASLADDPSVDALLAARAALYGGALDRLLEAWREARAQEEQVDSSQSRLRDVPELTQRLVDWWAERPDDALVLDTPPLDAWPALKDATDRLREVQGWSDRWKAYVSVEHPAQLQKSDAEFAWATSQLRQAVDVLPGGEARDEAQDLVESLEDDPMREWPVAEITDLFAVFSPEHIRGDISRMEAELEQGSFDDAKAAWLERLRIDDDAVRAVDALDKSIRQHGGQVVEEDYDVFRTALRAVPIWVTTAPSTQAIPVEPELFDIVVIDEASQCTLTNLLPLMYRGKTMVVIGDHEQLPAIPTVYEREELALARKFGVEQHLSLIGHASNDVYTAATESLPRRRADVLMLTEHFRSHPQIIGFSNRHIYLQALELKRDPSRWNELPIPSGVHRCHISGVAQRGERGSSWRNQPEAEVALNLVKQIRQGDGRSLSLGIVTPFRAQKEMLRERLESMGLASDVLVDVAHGFQGDERDVILFSPVVARGIDPGSGLWVEKPPNLINVALTRAREALFVVADFDYLKQQEGILRKLALYCDDVQLLRDTSEAELELFSWMVVKGWEPQIHPRIGKIEVDFVLKGSSGRKLAIEVDGQQHDGTKQKDKARDAYLQGQGFDVFRTPARAVRETPYDVVHQMEEWLDKPRRSSRR